MIGNPDINRKSLARGAKLIVQEKAFEERHERLLSQEREGQMFRCTSSDAADIWGRALWTSQTNTGSLPSIVLWTPYLIMPISIYGVRGMMMPVPSAAIAKPSYMSSMLAQWPYRLDATTIAMMQCSGRSLLLSQTIFYQQKHSLPTSLTTSFPITLSRHHRGLTSCGGTTQRRN